MKKISVLCGFIILLLIGSSCSSYKDVPYYQDLNRSQSAQEVHEPITNYKPVTIKPADVLSINVNSMNPEAAILFNPNLGEGSSYTAENAQHRGYLVDDKGNIDLPLIGLMQVSGLTTSELRENLKKALLKYYNDPVVNVRIANITVAVYGDVEKPNVYPLQNERTTITQAISMAGDLNITGMRTNVLLVREENGERHFITIDLTSKNIFDSPYYYLRNNDEIYVQPDKTKFATVDRGYHTATLTLSGLSIIAIVLSNILLYKR